MIYIYSFIDGGLGKSTEIPTDEDYRMVIDGQMEVLRISTDGHLNIFVESWEPPDTSSEFTPDPLDDDQWFDTRPALSDSQDGNLYHFCD